ncbi:TOPRIM nucleotidyl transferase/hydrolase domain-containing protein [Streptomyces cavourensis]
MEPAAAWGRRAARPAPAGRLDKRGVAVAKVGGKGSIERYRKFFEAFGVTVFALTDLDSLLQSFNKLGASAESAALHQSVMDKLHQFAKPDFSDDAKIKSDHLRALQKSPDIKSIWESVTQRAADHKNGLCEWDDLAKEVEIFFPHANSQKRPDELAAADPPELKAQSFCDTCTTADELRKLDSFAGDPEREFDLIFKRIFG